MDYIKKNIYYLNMQELKDIANKYNIPIKIYAETPNLKQTCHIDRKNIIIDKIIKTLLGKPTRPTIYPKSVIRTTKIINLTPKSKVYYGQYKNGNNKILALMKKLTDGKFKYGAISCMVINKYWSKGKAPTYEQFAKTYMYEYNNPIDHPEWQYIQFMRKYNDKSKWTKIRSRIAKSVINKINQKLS